MGSILSSKLISRDGITVEVDSVIEVLEQTTDKNDLLKALRLLRQGKGKGFLDQTERSAQFDRLQVLENFLHFGKMSEQTQKTYAIESDRFFSWIDCLGIHELQVSREDVGRFKAILSEKYSANTVRLTLAACSSFYSYLENERYIEHSPFVHIKYPKREYKKAIRPDNGKQVPVMSEREYQTILEAIEKKSNMPGDAIYVKRAREGARRLLPIVHFLGAYGSRVSDVLTVRMEGEDRFSFREKSGKIRQKQLKPVSADILARCNMLRREPFKVIAKVTIQGAIRRVTEDLASRGLVRSAYSAHDFRHFFAVSLYRDTEDIYAVKEELGHATIGVTEEYLAGLGAIRSA